MKPFTQAERDSVSDQDTHDWATFYIRSGNPDWCWGYYHKTDDIPTDILMCKRDAEKGVPRAIEMLAAYIAWRMR